MSIPMVRSASRAFRAAPRWRMARRTLSSISDDQQKLLSSHLQEADTEVYGIIEKEKTRQKHFINLIPSENFTSQAVLDALGSPMQNKYSEGYPGARYYGGNQFIDESERLCQKRALETFGLDEKEWGVNVQALSGAPANLYVYSALMNTHDRLMGLDLPHGGHLSHGYQTPTKKISFVSKYFETVPYRLDESTGLIDYGALDGLAKLYRPKVIVAGASAYARAIDYVAMRKTADASGAYLLADMAHIAGLVAARVMPSPFPHSDVVTTTSHKSLRGPRGALIFYRKGVRRTSAKGVAEMYDLESRINASVFPGHQGGPHNHTIAALAVALRQAQEPSFRDYQRAVLANSKAFSERLQELGYVLVGGGTDNHLVLVDLAKSKQNGGDSAGNSGSTPSASGGLAIDGARAERLLELVGVAANKNTVPGDRSALVPHGLRMGTPAMTSRGFAERDFERVAEIVDRAVKVAGRVDVAARRWADDVNAKDGDEVGDKMKPGALKTFLKYLDEHAETDAEIVRLRQEVEDWVGTYPVPWRSVGGAKK